MPIFRTGISVFSNISRYEKITDLSTNSGDHEIHEHVVEGTTGRLRSVMDHHAFPTIDSFVEKHNRYSNWEESLKVHQRMMKLLCNMMQLKVNAD